MALLYLLHRHRIKTTVVHCNYQVRGERSDRDQQMVEQFAALWDMECVSLKLDPTESDSTNFQNWAREERYRIFRELKQESGARAILTAHHEDDQAETILQKMLRGGGFSSWQGMKIYDGDLFRPLLNCSKREILQFVEEQNIPYRIDSTNEESTYARNFIRNSWFPELTKLFPGWRENLLNIPTRATEFQLLAEYVLDQVTDGQRRLRRSEFLALNKDLRSVIFHRFVEKQTSVNELSRRFLHQLNDLETLQTGKSLTISPSLSLMCDREFFVLKFGNERHLIERMITKEEALNGISVESVRLQAEPFSKGIEKGVLKLDLSTLEFPLTLRTWRNGDTIQPMGMSGTQTIAAHLTNRKISAQKKRQAFVLISFDGTLSAVIFPDPERSPYPGTISETVRCNSETSHVLTIRI